MSNIFNQLKKDISEKRVIIIVGAGVSIATTNSAPTASWIGLLRNGIDRVIDLTPPDDPKRWKRRMEESLEIAELDDLLDVATRVSERLKAPLGPEYRLWLRDSVGSLHNKNRDDQKLNTEVIEALASLEVPIATTNYDHLLEEVTKSETITWMDKTKAKEWVRGERNAILHFHGHYDTPESVILGTRSYQRILEDQHAQTLLQALRTTKSFLFVGFGGGLEDPNFGSLIEWSRQIFSEDTDRHIRLCLESEQETIQELHVSEDRIFALPYGEKHSNLSDFLKQLRPESGKATPENIKSPPSKAHNRPKLSLLPPLDPDNRISTEFIGRQDVIGVVEDAINGCLARFYNEEIISNTGHIQALWLQGFGGMGKSWMLRYSCIQAVNIHPEFKTALIDWDLQSWCEPVSGEPLQPRHVLDPIAYRLAQIYSTENLDPYWDVVAEINANAKQHYEITGQIRAALKVLEDDARMQLVSSKERGDYLPDWRQHALELGLVLEEQGILSQSPERRIQQIRNLKQDYRRLDQILETWAIERFGVGDNDAILRPDKIRAEALRKCIRQLCRTSPLIIVLDTCELLDQKLDRFLLDFFAPLIDGSLPLTLLIGSRRAPDTFAKAGESSTWNNQIGRRRFRSIDFDEGFHFTISEIENYLNRLGFLSESNDLAGMLHRVTLGVPLALRVLLDDVRDGGDSVMRELADWNVDDLDLLNQTEAAQLVIEKVTNRFLLHLQKDNRPKDDLRDTILLGLLQRADLDLLALYWDISHPVDRLRELSQRYSLMAGNDLHPTVRLYLKRCWRSNPIEFIPEIVDRLLNCHEELKPNALIGEELHYGWTITKINLLTWKNSEIAVSEIARALVVGIAWERKSSELVHLLQGLRTVSDKFKQAFKQFQHLTDALEYGELPSLKSIEWLKSIQNSNWHPEEIACLYILEALRLNQDSEELIVKELHTKAMKLFEAAFSILDGNIPRPVESLNAYLHSTFSSTIDDFEDDAQEQVMQALDWAKDKSFLEGFWRQQGCLLHNLGKHEESVESFKRAIAEDSNDELAYGFLWHALDHHLNRYNEAASAILGLLEIVPNHEYMLGALAVLYAERLDEYDKASEIYEKILDMSYDPDIEVYIGYGKLLYEHLGSPKKAEKMLKTGAKQDSDSLEAWMELAYFYQSQGKRSKADKALSTFESLVLEKNEEELNSIAWKLYTKNFALDIAEKVATIALSFEPKSNAVLHTLAAIQVRHDRWDEAIPNIINWVETTKENLINWNQEIDLFRDAIHHKHAGELADLVENIEPQSLWIPIAWALRASLLDDVELAKFDTPLKAVWKNRALKIREQFISNEPVDNLPPLETK